MDKSLNWTIHFSYVFFESTGTRWTALAFGLFAEFVDN